MGKRKLAALQTDVIEAARAVNQLSAFDHITKWMAEQGKLMGALAALDDYLEADISGPGEYVEGSPETSRNAALSVVKSSTNVRWRILCEIFAAQHANSFGLTDEQLEHRLRGKHQTISAARQALVAKGWLDDGGRRWNGTKRAAVVWEFTKAGQARMREMMADG